MNRRSFLKAGLAITPVAAVLAACSKDGSWPEGMQKIVWDRDTCAGCGMVISDRRFAVEAQSPDAAIVKFDDIGCAVSWLRDRPWGGQARLWVADAEGKGARWLDARTAQYIGGRNSPMGYNFAAVAHPAPGSMGFADLQQHLLVKGR